MDAAYGKAVASESLLLTKQLKNAIPLSLILSTSVWLLVLVLKKGGPIEAIKSIPGLGAKTTTTTSTAVTKPNQKPARKPGEWTPSSFKRPRAPPYPNWDIKKTKPLPYRPFRYGPTYAINMGIRSMKWDDWIELDNDYLRYHKIRAQRIKERGDKLCRMAPEAVEGAYELLDELCDYLPERYPSMFKKTPTGIHNLVTGEIFNTVERPTAEDPLIIGARLIQDDLVLMVEKEDGVTYLLGGAVLVPGFWRLEDKFGMSLTEIHTSGDVPHYMQKLDKSINNFFRRIQPEDPHLRNNYFIQVDDELAWSPSIGSEDSDAVTWNTAQKDKAIEHHYFRSERQSIRRLPKSGVVAFTIRTYFEPITKIANEPYVPGRLASGIRSWDKGVAEYKGRGKYENVLLEYLDRKHQEQVANGLDLAKEEEIRSYPW